MRWVAVRQEDFVDERRDAYLRFLASLNNCMTYLCAPGDDLDVLERHEGYYAADVGGDRPLTLASFLESASPSHEQSEGSEAKRGGEVKGSLTPGKALLGIRGGVASLPNTSVAYLVVADSRDVEEIVERVPPQCRVYLAMETEVEVNVLSVCRDLSPNGTCVIITPLSKVADRRQWMTTLKLLAIPHSLLWVIGSHDLVSHQPPTDAELGEGCFFVSLT
jgi:hypothetical protein